MGFWKTVLIHISGLGIFDLLKPKIDIENAKPGDIKFHTSTEQRPLARWWGTVPFPGMNVMWWGDRENIPNREKITTGMFETENQIVGYEYYMGIQYQLGMGEADALTRYWIDDKIIMDSRDGGDPELLDGDSFFRDLELLFGGDDLGGQGGFIGEIQFFAGSSTQTPSPYLSQFQKEPPDTGSSPGYVGVAYVATATRRWYVGISPNIHPHMCEARRIPNGIGMTLGRELVNGEDANPACVLYELLTEKWGFGIDPSDVDAPNFAIAGNTLFDEGNGFSHLLESEEDVAKTLKRVEEQIDGIVYLNPMTEKYELALIRDDYDIMTVPEVVAGSNLVKTLHFNQGTWETVSSRVILPFSQRDVDNYKDANARAADPTAAAILGSEVVITIKHPGIKNKTLANAIAWREMRTNARPLAVVSFVTDRSLHGVLPGDVISYTNPRVGANKLPIRIRSVDYGRLLQGGLTFEGTQDVFRASAGSFGDPPDSGWEDPEDVFVDYAVAERLAFEAPRMFTARSSTSATATADRVCTAARQQGNEVVIDVVQRNDPGVPSGAFSLIGETFGFMLIGELKNALLLGPTQPVVSLLLTTTPDTQADIVDAIRTITDVNELGSEITNTILIGGDGGEYVLPQSAQVNGADVQLNNVFRGIGDSVQQDHAAGTPVYMLLSGVGVSSSGVTAGNNVEVKLLPRSTLGSLAEGDATSIDFQMDNRTRRPYPPATYDLNGTELDTTSVALDGGGLFTDESVGITVDAIRRRDYRTQDEILGTQQDAESLDATFPAFNATTVEVEIRDGVTVLDSDVGLDDTGAVMRQLDILAALDTTTLPASLTSAVRESHTFDGVVYKSREFLGVTFTVASPYVGKHAFGELDDGEVSNSFTVVAPTVDHVFNMSTAFTVGDVEYQINAGGFLTLISAGGTSGTIPNASLSASDTIQIRHNSSDTNPQKLLAMTVSGTEEAYAVLIS